MEKRLIHVEWVDATTSDGWESFEASLLHAVSKTCETIGFLLKQDEKEIVVCHTIDQDCDTNGRIAIPIAFVRGITEMGSLGCQDRKPKSQESAELKAATLPISH